MGLVTLKLKDGRQWGGLLPEEDALLGMMILAFRTQWRKVKQMQPMQLCTFSWRPFKGTFKNLKMHSGEKSNKCNQCDYASSQERNLRTHLKTHSGEKLNKCSQCDYASSRSDVLRTHLKAHNREKSNKCNQCDFAFSYASALRTHLKNEHWWKVELILDLRTQWRKVEQMQPMWLYLFSGRQFKGTFENAQWRKVKQMQPMWLCLFWGRRFEETFKNAQWGKVKQM